MTKSDDKREKNTKNISKENAVTEHPGLGEGGRFHQKADEHPVPKGTAVSYTHLDVYKRQALDC